MTAVAAVAGLAVDAVLGEPPVAWHPVGRYGAIMQRLEERTYAPRRPAGVVHLAAGVGVALGAGVALGRMVGRPAATVVAVSVCAAGTMLDTEARHIERHLRRGELDLARRRLRSLAGRDASALDATGVSRAVVESLAENCVDAVTATAWWAAVGGAPAALVHRAVNTLDAMVGYRNDRYEHFGWASARIDDLLNHVPARLTVLGVAAVRPHRAVDIARTVCRDAGAHPSPNGGAVEAAFAAALGVQLGGVNRYGDAVEDRGTLGTGRAPVAGDIPAAVRLRRDATAAVVVILIGAAAIRQSIRQRWRRRNR